MERLPIGLRRKTSFLKRTHTSIKEYPQIHSNGSGTVNPLIIIIYTIWTNIICIQVPWNQNYMKFTKYTRSRYLVRQIFDFSYKSSRLFFHSIEDCFWFNQYTAAKYINVRRICLIITQSNSKWERNSRSTMCTNNIRRTSRLLGSLNKLRKTSSELPLSYYSHHHYLLYFKYLFIVVYP